MNEYGQTPGRRGRLAEAVPAFRRAIELDPENAVVFTAVLEELRSSFGRLGTGSRPAGFRVEMEKAERQRG